MSRVIGPPPRPRVRRAMRRSDEAVMRGAVCTSRHLRGGGLNGLDLQLDLDLVADQQAAGLEHLVPPQAEVLAIDRRPGRERHALVAPRILALAAVLDVERHLAGDAADREIAEDAVVVLAELLD